MENRHGLAIGADVSHVSGAEERDGVLGLLVAAGIKEGTALGADEGYATQGFVGCADHSADRTADRAQHGQRPVQRYAGFGSAHAWLCHHPEVLQAYRAAFRLGQ